LSQGLFKWGVIASPLALWAGFVSGCASAPPPAASGQYVALRAGCLDARTAALIVREAEGTIEEVSDFLALPPPQGHVTVFAFRSRLALTLWLLRNCPRRWYAGAACFETHEGFHVAIPLSGEEKESLRYLRHEMAHYVIASRFCDVPPWLDEGLAQIFETRPGEGDSAGRIRSSLARSPDWVLDGIVSIPPGRRLTRRQYEIARSVALFIVTRFPDASGRIKGYLETVTRSRDPSVQFAEWFERAPADWEPAWREFVSREGSR